MTVNKTSEVEFKKRLGALLRRSENKICCDCPEKRPAWASVVNPPPNAPIGSRRAVVFLCFACASAHRKLGTSVCVVKNVSSSDWLEDEVRAAEKSGNSKVNQIYEVNLAEDPSSDTRIKPLQGAHIASRERFVREKYMDARFYSRELHQQQIQMEDPSTPGSPRKRGSLLKFLKKESSQNSTLGKSSECSATADMTKSMVLSPTMRLEREEMDSGSRSVCPQVQITRKAAPTLNEKDWAKVTRGAQSERNHRSIDVQVGLGVRDRKSGRPSSTRSDFNPVDDSPLQNSESSFEMPSTDAGANNSERSPGEHGHSSSVIRMPDHQNDARRAAFNKSRSTTSFNASSSDMLERDAPDGEDKTSGNKPDSRRRLVATTSMPIARNSRMNLYSANGRGRSKSKTRDANGERPRSQSRGLGEKESGRRARSSSRRRHATLGDEYATKRSSSRQRRPDDNAKQDGARRGRSTSRRRGQKVESTPTQQPQKQVPGMIDLTASPRERRSKKSSRRDGARSRSRSVDKSAENEGGDERPTNLRRGKKGSRRDVGRSRSRSVDKNADGEGGDERLEAYRNGTESPIRGGGRPRNGTESPIRGGDRPRNGRDSPLRGGRRERSRSGTRKPSSTNQMIAGGEEEKPRPSRRSSKSGRRATLGDDKKSDGAHPQKSSERRARSVTRKKEESLKPRRPRSKSLQGSNKEKCFDVQAEAEAPSRPTEATNVSNRSLNIESGFSEHDGKASDNFLENGEMSFQVVAGCSNPDFEFSDVSKFLGETGKTDSFRKPYRKEKKNGGDAYEKEKRRIGRTKLSEQIKERASRRSGIFASIDREEDEAKTSSGPLMRRGNMSSSLLDDGRRPFHLRGHVSVSELGKSKRLIVNSKRRSSRLGDSTPDFGNLGLGDDSREP